MTNKNLLQEAIAEAKTIRQAAITNAKEALEESLTPHLKEMLAKKLQEMDEADNNEVVDENINNTVDEHELVNNVNEEAEEAEDDMPIDDEAPEDEMPEDDMPAEEKKLDFENMDRDDFKDLLVDLMGEIEAEKSEEMPGEEMPGEEMPDDNAIDIDEPSTNEEINIDELLAELAGEEVKEDLYEAKKKAAKEKEAKEKELAAKKKENKDLKEALDTVHILRTQLQEVNLLNAKLLYVNKVFKSNNLTESQKVNVVAAFDKAETVKEVKLVFETVSKNVVGKKLSTIKEHTSFASKPTGTTASAPKEIINEVSEQVLRMQKLAGIIK